MKRGVITVVAEMEIFVQNSFEYLYFLIPSYDFDPLSICQQER